MGCVKSRQNKFKENNIYQLFDPKSKKLFSIINNNLFI